MAKMVFGEWRGDGTGSRQDVTHFATAHDLQTGYTLACGAAKLSWRVQAYGGFAASPERRLEQGERRTTCKNCRRTMGWATPTAQWSKR